METNLNYIPFSDDWKKEISKMKKADIIEMYATSQRINQKRTAEKNALENWLESKIKSIEEDIKFESNHTAADYIALRQELKTLKGILKIIEV